MKPRSKMLDFSFRRNEHHILTGILEYILVTIVTMIAIIAVTAILKDQIALMIFNIN